MTQAKQGDKVAINFIGKLEDGTIIDSTYPDPEESSECGSKNHACNDEGCCGDSGPFELEIGAKEFYIPIEEALVGMAPGDKKTLVISPDDAFGDYDSENVFNVPRSEFPEDEITPELGLELEVDGEDDEVFMATIIKLSDEDITLDTNHPLAGEELTYEFELVEILK